MLYESTWLTTVQAMHSRVNAQAVRSKLNDRGSSTSSIPCILKKILLMQYMQLINLGSIGMYILHIVYSLHIVHIVHILYIRWHFTLD